MITSQQRSAALDLLLRWDKDDSFDNHDAIDQLAAILQPAPPARQVVVEEMCEARDFPDGRSPGTHIYRSDPKSYRKGMTGAYAVAERHFKAKHEAEIASLKQQIDREREILAGPVTDSEINQFNILPSYGDIANILFAHRRASLEKKEPELEERIIHIMNDSASENESAQRITALVREMEKKG